MFCCVFVCLFAVIVDTVSSHSYCRGTNCRDDRCLPTGECLDGCRDGFLLTEHGRCVRACAEHCRTCTGYGQCAQCKESYFGEMCDHRCSDGCRHFTCDKDTGKCTFGNEAIRSKNGLRICCLSEKWYVTERCDYTGVPEGESFIYICLYVAAGAASVVVVVIIVLIGRRFRNKHRYKSVQQGSTDELTNTRLV